MDSSACSSQVPSSACSSQVPSSACSSQVPFSARSSSAFPSARFSRASPSSARFSRASPSSARFSRASPSRATPFPSAPKWPRLPSALQSPLLLSSHLSLLLQSTPQRGISPISFFWGGYLPLIWVAIVAILRTFVRVTMAYPPWPPNPWIRHGLPSPRIRHGLRNPQTLHGSPSHQSHHGLSRVSCPAMTSRVP